MITYVFIYGIGLGKTAKKFPLRMVCSFNLSVEGTKK